MKMPVHIADLLILLFSRAGMEPAYQDEEALGYDLEYESGLVLQAMIITREEKRWFSQRGFLDIWILNPELLAPTAHPLMKASVLFPRSANDVVYGMKFAAKLLAMAQASSHVLGGGRSLRYKPLPSALSRVKAE